jgi:hypothetical protein
VSGERGGGGGAGVAWLIPTSERGTKDHKCLGKTNIGMYLIREEVTLF